MQYQKDEVRNRIIEEALKEFNEKGYEGASIRTIAKRANTSVGNIYKYFESKEDLHDNIVGAVYNKFIDYVKKFNNMKLNEQSKSILYNLLDEIMEIFNEKNLEISILFNQSKGSKYEGCKSIFVDFATRMVTEQVQYELSLKGKRLKDNFIIYLLSNSLLESIAIIVKERSNGAEVKRLILNLIDIFYTDIVDKLDIKDLQ
ncbi:TetR/AcrR family transcriptional regulator [Clostridium sp. SYSU_GA19001]|uniref:TetR/AcrR family transcriptional regulator n=1 Tax=Clostridium caldaquaticum TaxID=2940653 RepID=UPI002076F12C|nr:TetR/AcrR family transcriptional regulator [Clostridium caldaquaticum]MCM8710212.1 TetR/AcrR family transcriptional regulator [Clostridium caldaquaticum]